MKCPQVCLRVPFSSEEKGSSPSASLGEVILPKGLSPGFSQMIQPSRIHLMLFIFCLLLGLFSFQIIGPNSNFEHKEGLTSSHDPGRANAEPGESWEPKLQVWALCPSSRLLCSDGFIGSSCKQVLSTYLGT